MAPPELPFAVGRGLCCPAVPTLEQTRKVEKLRAELQAKEEEIAKVEESIRETWELPGAPPPPGGAGKGRRGGVVGVVGRWAMMGSE